MDYNILLTYLMYLWILEDWPTCSATTENTFKFRFWTTKHPQTGLQHFINIFNVFIDLEHRQTSLNTTENHL